MTRNSEAPFDDSPIPSAWQRRIEGLEERVSTLETAPKAPLWTPGLAVDRAEAKVYAHSFTPRPEDIKRPSWLRHPMIRLRVLIWRVAR